MLPYPYTDPCRYCDERTSMADDDGPICSDCYDKINAWRYELVWIDDGVLDATRP